MDETHDGLDSFLDSMAPRRRQIRQLSEQELAGFGLSVKGYLHPELIVLTRRLIGLGYTYDQAMRMDTAQAVAVLEAHKVRAKRGATWKARNGRTYFCVADGVWREWGALNEVERQRFRNKDPEIQARMKANRIFAGIIRWLPGLGVFLLFGAILLAGGWRP